jgi:hypothetical protein
MPRTRQPAAPAPAPLYTRAFQGAAAGTRWIATNSFILSIIAFNGATSFNHMTYLASAKGGQHGADVQLAATIFDLFVFAMRIESQRDKKRGTISRLSIPVFLQMVALTFSVLANYATKSDNDPFWGTTFAVAPPIMVMLAILVLERRYRLDALAGTAPGTGQGAAGTEAGTGAGTGGAPAGTGTGTAPRTAPAPAGTGTGAPAGEGGEGPEADVLQLHGGYFMKDGKHIPAGITVPGDDDRPGQLIAVREASVKYLARNLDSKTCPAWALAAALRKNKTWVLAARTEIEAEDTAAEAARASAAADPDTTRKELSA